MTSKAAKKDSKRDDAAATASAAAVNMAAMTNLLEEHRAALSAEFKSAITSFETKLDHIQTAVTDHGHRLTSLEDNANQLSDKMEALEIKCAAMEERYNKLKFKDLFKDGHFVSFSQLSEGYHIPKTHFFRYLQVRDYVRSALTHFPDEPSANPIDTFLSLDPLCQGALSTLYRKTSLLKYTPLDKIKTAWVHDLGQTIPTNLWDSILASIHKSSMCIRHCLIQFKIVHRAHMSKVKLSSIYPDITPTCDKCKNSDATLIHMYWLCPQLQTFWKDVFGLLSNILRKNFDPDPLIALLGVTDRDDSHLTATERRMVTFALLLARRTALLKWKGAAPPTLSQWLRDLMSCLKLEMLRFSVSILYPNNVMQYIVAVNTCCKYVHFIFNIQYSTLHICQHYYSISYCTSHIHIHV